LRVNEKYKIGGKDTEIDLVMEVVADMGDNISAGDIAWPTEGLKRGSVVTDTGER